jgi:hypothetical protein
MTIPFTSHSILRFPSAMGLPALISIHDVMPETLQQVEQLLVLMKKRQIGIATLLVVPGKQWKEEDLSVLRSFEAAGFELAGHGWHHRCKKPQSFGHRLHSRCISRSVAEHLALSRKEIVHLLTRSHSWFTRHGLSAPVLYVPPAWVMGAVLRSDLSTLPYRLYETLSGIFDAENEQFLPLPLCGFEADTVFRKHLLRCLNAINLWWAGNRLVPVRVAIHPFDLQLRLCHDLLARLSGTLHPIGYGQIGT